MAASLQCDVDEELSSLTVTGTIQELLKRKEFNLPSNCCAKFQEFGKQLCTRIASEDSETVATMTNFTISVQKMFDDILQEAPKQKHALPREKRHGLTFIWHELQQLRKYGLIYLRS